MNAFHKNSVGSLQLATNLKLAEVCQGQAKEFERLGAFEEAEKVGDLGHDLRVKVALELYPNLNKEEIELIGAVLWFLGCWKRYPVLQEAQIIAHNQKVFGKAYTLTEWVDYPEKYRSENSKLLSQLYSN